VTTDYAAVAGSAVLGTPGIRVCLLVSTDGLPLGAYPATDERRAASVWTRLSSLGRVRRGFVTVDDEMWAFDQNEHHGVLLIADPKARAAILLEVAGQVLATVRLVGGLAPPEAVQDAGDAGDARELKDLRPPAGRGIRTPLHPDAKPGTEPAVPEPAPVVVALEGSSAGAAGGEDIAGAIAEAVAEAARDAGSSEPAEMHAQAAGSQIRGGGDEGVDRESADGGDSDMADPIDPADPQDAAEDADRPAPEGTSDIDAVALAREFSGLLFDREDGTP
jgi:hypothetical protein